MNDLFDAVSKVLTLGALLFGLVALIRFYANDARRRGKSPLLVVLASALFFPWGLIAWLIFRPDLPGDGRNFRFEDLRLQ